MNGNQNIQVIINNAVQQATEDYRVEIERLKKENEALKEDKTFTEFDPSNPVIKELIEKTAEETRKQVEGEMNERVKTLEDKNTKQTGVIDELREKLNQFEKEGDPRIIELQKENEELKRKIEELEGGDTDPNPIEGERTEK
jgi:predicted  nucleic acid-binding Zn-ribbon protein